MNCLTTKPGICLTLAKTAEISRFLGKVVVPEGLQLAPDYNPLSCLPFAKATVSPLRDRVAVSNLSAPTRLVGEVA